MSSIYIHIPDVPDLKLKKKIESAILKEINIRYNELNENVVHSIYIKSPKTHLLSSNFLEALISRLNNYFFFDNELEITLELDVNNIKTDNLKKINETKVNRLSCRTYSLLCSYFSNEKADDFFFEKLSLVSKFFKNFSIDVLFGIPNLSKETLDNFLKKVNEKNPLHVTLEEFNNTFNNLSNQCISVDKSLVVDQYNFCCEKFIEYGFEQYEYLNFSRGGNYSKQNLNYWNRLPYLGFGPSACSFLNESRSINITALSDYLLEINKFQKPLNIEYLSEKDIYNETIMTGLSISKGLSLEEIKKKFKSFNSYFLSKVKKHLCLKNIYLEKNFIKVNQKHKYSTDEIASDFFKY